MTKKLQALCLKIGDGIAMEFPAEREAIKQTTTLLTLRMTKRTQAKVISIVLAAFAYGVVCARQKAAPFKRPSQKFGIN